MPNPTLLTAAGYGSLVFATLHAASGRQFQRLRQFQELPNVAYVRSTVGWYQGSGYLVLNALLNLYWAKNPESLNDPLSRAMAAVMTAIAWASSAWYLRGGMRADGVLTAIAGVFQAYAALC